MSIKVSSGTRRVFASALLIFSCLATPSLAQTAAQNPAADNSSTPTQAKPVTKPTTSRAGQETRGVIDEKPSYCDVDPPCPPGCRHDTANKICVDTPKR